MGQADSISPSESTHSLPGVLAATPIIGILRRCPPAAVVEMAGAAFKSGVVVLEVTLDSENALVQIDGLRRALPGALIGAGSIRETGELIEAVDAGAAFIVSPLVDANVIATGLELGVPVIPGAATPTEINMALRLGAEAVKIFPASLLGGPAYLEAVMSPLGSPPLIPTGGVDALSAAAYLRAGAIAVGVGSFLFPTAALRAGDSAEISSRARELVAIVAAHDN